MFLGVARSQHASLCSARPVIQPCYSSLGEGTRARASCACNSRKRHRHSVVMVSASHTSCLVHIKWLRPPDAMLLCRGKHTARRGRCRCLVTLSTRHRARLLGTQNSLAFHCNADSARYSPRAIPASNLECTFELGAQKGRSGSIGRGTACCSRLTRNSGSQPAEGCTEVRTTSGSRVGS